MRGLFNYDGPVISFLGKVADLMLLNILTLICCIPIVTAGAAFTALYYMTIKMVKKEEGYIARGFFKSFKENFKQATIIWLIVLAVSVLLIGDYFIMTFVAVNLPKALMVLVWAAAILFLFEIIYVFAVLSRFDNPVLTTIKNAFLMSILHFPKTIVMAVIFAVPVIAAFQLPEILPIIFLFGISIPAYAASYFFVGIFKRYEPEEEEERIGEI